MVQRAVVSLLAALVAVALASCSTSGRKDAADSVARQRGFRICFAVAAVDGFGGRNGFWASRDDIRKDPEVARRVSQEFYRVVRHSLPNTDPDEAFLGCADAIVGGWPPDVPVSAPLARGRTTETATAEPSDYARGFAACREGSQRDAVGGPFGPEQLRENSELARHASEQMYRFLRNHARRTGEIGVDLDSAFRGCAAGLWTDGWPADVPVSRP